MHTDPTYKEWKRYNSTLPPLKISHTDPTYKEWKPAAAIIVRMAFAVTRILPTRNGNHVLENVLDALCIFDTDPTYKEWKLMNSSL